MKLFRKLLAAALLPAALLLSACGAAAPQTTAVPEPGADLEVYCFAAGKADAFLLTTEESAVLIDAGEKGFGKEILAYLAERGVDSLDYFIVTHFDQDHVGGAAKVLNSIPVGAVLQSNRPKDSEEYEKYAKALENAGIVPVTVRETLCFELDGVFYTVAPPREEEYAEDASNNSSLIVSVANGEDDLLFAGDAEDARMAEFAAENATDYDFLKVPHHGNWHKTLTLFLDSTTPEYAVITCSDEEPEDARTTALLSSEGVETWLTRSGAVRVTSGGSGITVEYEN